MVGLEFLLWLREHALPWLDSFMGAVTYLGTEYFYLAALCFLYWCVDVSGTLRLSLLLLSSFYLREAVKEFTAVPRPFDFEKIGLTSALYEKARLLHGKVRFEETAQGYAFPSGHAQDSVVFWGYLAVVFRRRWLYIVAPIVILLVAFSRLYLGLHWPRDVLCGLLFGMVFLGFGYILLRLLAGMPLKARFPTTLVLTLIPILFFLLFPSHSGAQSMGVIFGVALGYLLERRYVRFPVRGPIWQQVLKLLIGLAGALLLLVGLGAFFDALAPSWGGVRVSPGSPAPDSLGFFYGSGRELLTFVRYAIIGLWATLIAPAIFRFLFGRQEREEPAASA